MPLNRTTHVFKTVGDCPIHADVYRVPGDRHPAILWLHGGALLANSRTDLPAAQQARYAQAGYTVVSADYRLAPETKLPAILTDLQDVYTWMRTTGAREFGIDPDRITVMGESAGGYLTLLAGYHLSPRPRAVAAFYGYSDIDGAWYSQPDPYYCQFPAVTEAEARAAVGTQIISELLPGRPNNRGLFYRWCRQNGFWPKEVIGFDPQTEPRALDPYCSIRNVTADYPPAFLAHGQLDTDVPHEQSAQMARELERQGVPHQFISLPNHGHAFAVLEKDMGDPVILGVFDQAIEFMDRHAAPR
jgi:acetyl esterase/lipase